MRVLVLLILFYVFTADINAQAVKSVVPDTGSQGASFPIVVHGIGTEWTLSPYYEIYFDSIGVTTSGVTIVNDSTLTGTILIEGKASYGFHKCVVADQYNNYYMKDSAFFVRLSKPAVPTLLLPENNSVNVYQNPYFLWDSNGYATSFRIQIASDSLFGSIVFDSVLANTPFTLRLGVLNLGATYFWRVNATNVLGTSNWSEIWKFRVRTVFVYNISSEIPGSYYLFPNYPNPFNSSTKIKFQIPENGFVKLSVFDVTGREIAGLVDQKLNAGIYETGWNAGNIPSGIYFFMFESGHHREVKRAVLLK